MVSVLGPGDVSVGFCVCIDHSDEVGGFVAWWRPVDTGQFRSQDLTLAFTEMTSLNSLEPQYPCPILGNMKCPYHRAVVHGRPWEYRPVEVLEKILLEFKMGSYMCKHSVKCFVNKR